MSNPKDILDQKNGTIEINAETRRIPKALIEEQIKFEREKELKEKELKQKEEFSKTTVIKVEKPIVQEEKQEEEISEDISNDKTQVISLEKDIEITPDQSKELEAKKNAIPFNSDLKYTKSQKQFNYTPWILIAAIIIVAVIFFSSIGPEKEENVASNTSNNAENDSKLVSKEDVAEDNIMTDDSDFNNEEETGIDRLKQIKPSLLHKTNIIETVILTNENLAGESQKKVKKKGALISDDIDPKIVAIVDGLIKRLEITNGVQTVTRRGVLSKRWKGTYRGFKIDAQKKEKGGKIILNKISLSTPSKGQLSIFNGVLNSIKKIKYESFIEELGKNGITITENELSNENSVIVNLEVLSPSKGLKKNEFLLSASGVFNIKGGDNIENIKLHLPEDFRVIKKNIVIDEQTSYNIHKVHNSKFHPLFFVKEWGGKIETVEITSTMFKTANGIGINSTIGLLRIYFPKLKIAKTVSNLVIVLPEGIDGYFIIDSTIEDFESLNFKDTAKIIKIVLE